MTRPALDWFRIGVWFAAFLLAIVVYLSFFMWAFGAGDVP